MDQFFEQLNQWGKDSVLQYGLTDTIIIILLILITAMVISRILTRLMKKRNFRNLPIWLKVKKYVIITITIYGILTLFIPAKTILDPLLASGGIVAVVVGLAAQETVGNLISGFMIVTFRPFHIGDLIRVNNGEYVGTVVEITIRHTIIETFENTSFMSASLMTLIWNRRSASCRKRSPRIRTMWIPAVKKKSSKAQIRWSSGSPTSRTAASSCARPSIPMTTAPASRCSPICASP